MTERERLIEILSVPIHPRIGADPAEVVADYLLDNGVIVPPVKVGDHVFWINAQNKIRKNEVFSVKIESEDNHFVFFVKCRVFNDVEMFYTFQIGKTAFLTREEAEAKLKEREHNG